MEAIVDRQPRVTSGFQTWERGQEPIFANLNFLVPTQQRPFYYAYQPPANTPWESCEPDQRVIPIYDARESRRLPMLEIDGFELWNAPTAVRDFMDSDEVMSTYYQECRELALLATGASKAYVFDHLVRKRENDRSSLTFGRKNPDGLAAANGRIHNDYSEASGARRLNLVLKDPAVIANVNRYSIVNIWRSIKGPVLDTPLAICAADSVLAKDLVVADVLYPERKGEIYVATFSPRQRWSYYSQMDRHEALVFKQYDSQLSGVSRFTPHTAFEHPDTPYGAPLRESIEIRCLVTY